MTIQQYFGEVRPADASSRNRRAMIEKVWAIWITGVLQPSLPHDILLELGLAEHPTMVTRALDLLVQRPDRAAQVQAPGTKLVDVFDRLDRALLILGAPGAGKTTLLLTLTRDLLQRAAQDPEHPIPVVFPLSSWAKQRRPLAAWLVDALSEQYDVPRKLGQAWVEADQILPLLDGLDEVAPEHRAACVEAINTFRQDHGLLPLVVCSRLADYQALGTQLRLQGALVMQPLTPQQVESYLTKIGQPLAAVREALRDEPTLWELLDTPLMLTIVTLAYRGVSEAVLRTPGTPAERQQQLFAAYVERMFRRRNVTTTYTAQQTEHWLAWLAWQMTQHNQTVFYLERMQPDWLPPKHQWWPTKGVAWGCGLGIGLVGLLSGWIGWVVAGVLGKKAIYSPDIRCIETIRWSWSIPGTKFIKSIILKLVHYWRYFLYFLLGYGLILISGLWLSGSFIDELLLLIRLRNFLGQVILVLLVLLVLLILLYASWLMYMFLVMPIWLDKGVTIGEMETKTAPNQGIHRSAWHALGGGLRFGLLGLVIWPISFILIMEGLINLGRGDLPKALASDPAYFWLAWGQYLGAMLLFPSLGGLLYGGRACLQHLVLRLLLFHNGSAPWHYVDFLAYATERLFLRQVGGGYMFIHRLLQDYFAALYTNIDDTANPDAPP